MTIHRRQFLNSVGVGAATAPWVRSSFAGQPGQGLKIGMCDWNLGPACDPSLFGKAREAGLSGVQVSVATAPDRVPLRDPDVRRSYQDAGRQYGITCHSVAAGGILNRIPLKSEPQSAVYVIDAIEAAAVLSAKNVLVAFFGDGDLRLTDSNGEFRNTSKNRFASYELDTQGVTRVVEALRQIVPRAEKDRVILGLENSLTAEQNLEIIARIGSEWVQVYYDVGNSTHYGYDVPSELKRLGNSRICEIHLKDWKTPLLGSAEGEVDFVSAATACREIGFDKWYVLESSGREGRFVEDTRVNVEFASRLFG